MQKIIGVEGSGKGQFNVMRLANDLKKINIECFTVSNDGEISLRFADCLEAEVDAICAAHNPVPMPTPKTEIELMQMALAEAIEKQEADNLASQLALAEYIESQAQGGE